MELVDFILHVDQHLLEFINKYENWVYLLLFLIIFVETGLVVMPFLPGDSLLFAVGMFAAQSQVSIHVVPALGLMFIAAILGDFCNYIIGKYLGEKALRWRLWGKPVINPKYLEKTHAFYEKYGSVTIVIARFMPFARTLAPFVAGVGHMKQAVFVTWNILGAALWVIGVGLIGFFLGNIEWVQTHFEKVVLVIIFISVLPVGFGIWKEWRSSRREKALAAETAKNVEKNLP